MEAVVKHWYSTCLPTTGRGTAAVRLMADGCQVGVQIQVHIQGYMLGTEKYLQEKIRVHFKYRESTYLSQVTGVA